MRPLDLSLINFLFLHLFSVTYPLDDVDIPLSAVLPQYGASSHVIDVPQSSSVFPFLSVASILPNHPLSSALDGLYMVIYFIGGRSYP